MKNKLTYLGLRAILHVMRYRQLTQDELKTFFEVFGADFFDASTKEFYEVAPDYPHPNLDENTIYLIFKSTLDREVFSIWDKFYRALEKGDIPSNLSDHVDWFAETFKPIRDSYYTEEYFEQRERTEQELRVRKEMDRYGYTLGVSMYHFVWNLELRDEMVKLSSFENKCLAYWVENLGISFPDIELEKEGYWNTIKDSFIYCVEPFLFMTSIVGNMSLKTLQAYKSQHGQDMSPDDFEEIRPQIMRLCLMFSGRSRSEGNSGVLSFLIEENNLDFKRNKYGAIVVTVTERSTEKALKTAEDSLPQDSFATDFQDEKPHMGCPVIKAKSGERPFLLTYIEKNMDVFKQSYFGLEAQPSAKPASSGCPFHQEPP